jgi:hypothetical protein
MTFDEIITPDERMEIAVALGEITMTIFTARAVVLNLHDFLTARIDSPPLDLTRAA